MNKLFLQTHPSDNVAIVLPPEGISPGSECEGITVREAIPQAHKIVIFPIERGAPLIRYGQVIGFANRELRPGDYAREEVTVLPIAPSLDDLSLASSVPATLPPLEGFTFEGYRNADGSAGTRNVLAIAT